MSNRERISANNASIQACIDKANALPNAGGEVKCKTEVEKNIEITENGKSKYTPNEGQVFSSVKVNVNVPIPDGYIQPADTMEITKNGEYNIAKFEKVNVDVEGSGGSGGNNNLMEYFEGQTTDLYWDDVKKLRSGAFSKQTMESARFLALAEVGGAAFEQCSALASIDMPEVTTIQASAFYSCGDLALTELPPKLSRIMGSAFENCSSLAITHIPASVVAIVGSAFKNCSGLTSITFKGKPNSIASTAFSGCTNLTTINVPWADGAVKNAPWGATNATINYNYTGG